MNTSQATNSSGSAAHAPPTSGAPLSSDAVKLLAGPQTRTAVIVPATVALPAKPATPCAKPKIPYAGKEPPPSVVAAGTVVDGIDCSGMTDDPKKIGVPIYLQTQNRKALTPEQAAKVKAIQAQTRAAEQAKKRERTEMAKKLGMSPLEMKKAGAKLKSEKGTTKAKGPAKTKSSKPKTKAAAAAPGAGKSGADGDSSDGPRKGSKTEKVGNMLLRETGCTAKQVLDATGWPTVSMPQQAKAAGLYLRKDKVAGKPTRYFGSATPFKKD